MESGNPHLKAAFLDVVNNQIANNQPPETRQTLDRLMSEGISEADARLYIAQAVCVEMWDVMKNQKTFNRERYIRNLNNLPKEPEE
ncbi:MAG TPA: DUF1841 family protein [Candidatus Hydrogenedentes bacterium]|nr:DUF1841 family protein [Candidatus Hydrogenedentota bacterium]